MSVRTYEEACGVVLRAMGWTYNDYFRLVEAGMLALAEALEARGYRKAPA